MGVHILNGVFVDSVDSLFYTQIDPSSDAYANLRDAGWNRSNREFAESLWARFAPYADSNFRDEIACAFHQRYWEMYLGFGLLEAGLQLESNRTAGPDFKAVGHEGVVWIEATAPEAGTGADAVPEMVYGQMQKVPDDRIILRLRGAIEEKYRKYHQYLESGQVSERDPYVIAINGRAVPHMESEGHPPKIVKTLYPIGSAFVSFDQQTGEKVDEGFLRRYTIRKISGAEVDTTVFSSPNHAGISAVLYCNSNAGNHPEDPKSVGGDFTILYNDNAKNPIQRGFLPAGTEFVIEGNGLMRHSKLEAAAK